MEVKRNVSHSTRNESRRVLPDLAADAGFLGCYRLDLCCGGIRPLAFVAQKHGLSLQEILGELNAEIAGAPSATK